MHRTLGATCVSCLLAVTGFSAIGAAGYMTVSGKSLCSAIHACGEKAKNSAEEKTVQTVANKESGEAKGCCAMKALAAKNAAKGECGSTIAKASFVTVKGSHPVVMPAMFFKADANFCTASLKEVGGCDKPCTGEGKVVKAVATEQKASGCCKAGKAAAINAAATEQNATGCSKAGAKTVAAKNTENADPKCCKGSGVRADGTPCVKDGDHCEKEKTEKAAEKPAEKVGEPVASRN